MLKPLRPALIRPCLCLSFLFTACLSASPPSPAPTASPRAVSALQAPLGTVFELPPRVSLRVTGTAVEVYWNGEVQDSRCPANVTCIWAGEVKLSLELREEALKHTLALKLPGEVQKGITVLKDRYRLTLSEVLPYPGTESGPPRLRLKLERI